MCYGLLLRLISEEIVKWMVNVVRSKCTGNWKEHKTNIRAKYQDVESGHCLYRSFSTLKFSMVRMKSSFKQVRRKLFFFFFLEGSSSNSNITKSLSMWSKNPTLWNGWLYIIPWSLCCLRVQKPRQGFVTRGEKKKTHISKSPGSFSGHNVCGYYVVNLVVLALVAGNPLLLQALPTLIITTIRSFLGWISNRRHGAEVSPGSRQPDNAPIAHRHRTWVCKMD